MISLQFTKHLERFVLRLKPDLHSQILRRLREKPYLEEQEIQMLEEVHFMQPIIHLTAVEFESK